ncbi:hypothetical protein [Metasolibacillus sp.]|uniref:hypothetical protein n=1 Tax=Metasolibacillus sp. TaxID=2703680 RepID=UPI0025EFFF33|nr:hypothetical protein [Metasolibacillus sp.]MCT6925674.1 hypothetical protein [Metasolibacillus sp.]MCT6940994.1 hypothetical protein [Metasolibacillus sp.]
MNNIINETIESYNQYMEKIPVGALYIAECLRTDKISEALSDITAFSEGVLWLIDVKILLARSHINAQLEIEKIQEFLSEINMGLEINDYVLVADMFEYEIAPFFEELVVNKVRIL